MATRPTQPLDPSAWLAAPSVVCVLLSVVLALPIKVFGLQPPEPVFAMAPAFAWAVIRPSILPPFALMALGLFQDCLWGNVLGLWPLTLLGLYGLAFLIRRVLTGQDFWPMFVWYGAICAAGFAIATGLTYMQAGAAPNLLGLALQWLPTLALFPLSWGLIVRFEDADIRFR